MPCPRSGCTSRWRGKAEPCRRAEAGGAGSPRGWRWWPGRPSPSTAPARPTCRAWRGRHGGGGPRGRTLSRAARAPAASGGWPTATADVPPHLLDMLIAAEDRRFACIPGSTRVALGRAALQWLRAGHVVSGGSTLTMQAARLLEPRPRTLRSKLIEIAPRPAAGGAVLQRGDPRHLADPGAVWAATWKACAPASLAWFGRRRGAAGPGRRRRCWSPSRAGRRRCARTATRMRRAARDARAGPRAAGAPASAPATAPGCRGARRPAAAAWPRAATPHCAASVGPGWRARAGARLATTLDLPLQARRSRSRRRRRCATCRSAPRSPSWSPSCGRGRSARWWAANSARRAGPGRST